jgi:hypothetical protein
MALILKDRVKETTAVTSTGTATLLGASIGYQSFSVIGNGNTCYYTIAAQTANEWEVGIGTYTSPDQLSRDTVLSSSNSGSLVNFSAGTKDVFVAQPSSKAVYTDATNIINTSGNGANTVTFTNINASNVVMVSGTISTNAANATDITNKTYVDSLFSTGITYHDPVLVESPTALTATYNQPGGAGNGVGATLTNSGANVALSIDGVPLSNTARVLVYQQSNAVHNGVYTVTNPGNVSAQWVLTRATDADTYGVGDPNKLGQGDAFFVQSGNTGAGETYILNTVGTITFGTTNLTFAQISSAQVYSAGTGLNLTNLAFSISNTAVTAATYGNAGQVPQIAVNAQGQITSASNVSINASSITTGTLAVANGGTGTGTAGIGAVNNILGSSLAGTTGTNTTNLVFSTSPTLTSPTVQTSLVTGSGTFALVNTSVVTLNFAGAVTTLNQAVSTANVTHNYSTGATLSGNTKTINLGTAGVSGSTTAINIGSANGTTVTVNGTTNLANVNVSGNVSVGGSISGNGGSLTAINASNISSGTIDNARTTAASANGASTIVSRDSGGNFSANTVTAAVIGDISGGSNINASNIASGTIANARTTASSSNGASTIVLRDAGGAFAAGAITGTSFSGNGSALTAINASAITTGTLDNARTNATSANGASTLVVRDANGSFAGNVITGTTGTFTNISGNGTSLTAINASNISSGTVASARISGSYTGITGVGTLTAGTWNANVIANAYTSAATANGASTIVLRGTSGEFSAGAITSVSISGNGVALTAINASNISSGTVATARLASGTANSSTYLRGDQTWATISAGVTITNDTSTNATYYPVFTTATSGTISAANVSSTELTFNPGTNILSAPVVSSSYGFSMNPATLSTSFTIPASFNAVSAGPVTLANGVTITVSTGSAWVVV